MFSIGKVEISANFEYLITLPGFMKIVEIVLAIVSIAVETVSSDEICDGWEEEFFSWWLGTVVAFSFLFLLAQAISDDIVTSKFVKILDVAVHISFGILVIIVSGFLVRGAVQHPTEDQALFISKLSYCKTSGVKILAAIFGVADGVLYCITAFIVFRTKYI